MRILWAIICCFNCCLVNEKMLLTKYLIKLISVSHVWPKASIDSFWSYLPFRYPVRRVLYPQNLYYIPLIVPAAHFQALGK